MVEIVGLVFGVISTILTLMVLYCFGMAFAVSIVWLFVGLGVLMTDLVAIGITYVCLRS